MFENHHPVAELLSFDEVVGTEHDGAFVGPAELGQCSADGQRGLIPAYTTWNASVNYTVGRTTVFVTAKNLLDTLFIVDRTRGILPGSPRLVQAGFRLRKLLALRKRHLSRSQQHEL